MDSFWRASRATKKPAKFFRTASSQRIKKATSTPAPKWKLSSASFPDGAHLKLLIEWTIFEAARKTLLEIRRCVIRSGAQPRDRPASLDAQECNSPTVPPKTGIVPLQRTLQGRSVSHERENSSSDVSTRTPLQCPARCQALRVAFHCSTPAATHWTVRLPAPCERRFRAFAARPYWTSLHRFPGWPAREPVLQTD